MFLNNSFCKSLIAKAQTGKEFILFLAQRAKADTILRVEAVENAHRLNISTFF